MAKIREPKVLRVGRSFQLLKVRANCTVKLPAVTLGAQPCFEAFVLWSSERLVHFRIQCRIAFQVVVISFDSLSQSDIERFFRFHAIDERLGTSSSSSFIELIDGVASEFQILLELVTGNKK